MLDQLPGALHGPVLLAVDSVCKSHSSSHPPPSSTQTEGGKLTLASNYEPALKIQLSL